MTELNQGEPENLPTKACINCGNANVLTEHPNALCADCRQNFIKYPIPKWVMLFAAGIGVLLLISLFNLPKNLSLGIDLQKGIKAIDEHRYVTAEKQMETFTKEVPESEEGNAYLMIACYNNLDFDPLLAAYKRLQDKKIDDEDLYNRVSALITKLDNYFPSDSLDALYKNHSPEDSLALYQNLKNYTISHPGDLYAEASYASYLNDKEQYTSADSLYNKILQQQDDYLPALYAMTTVKRLINKPEEAISYCNKLLEINKECIYAMSTKARALLKESKNKEALQTAQQAASLQPDDGYNTATLALVYHFCNMENEKNKMIQKMKQDTDSSMQMNYQFVYDIINNKEAFR